MLAGGVQPMLHAGVPCLHPPVASFANHGGGGAVDDRRAIDVGDDAALLDTVEEGDEAGLGAAPDGARREAAAFEGASTRSAGWFIGPLELLERPERVLYVDRCPERGSNAARCGAKARVRSYGR